MSEIKDYNTYESFSEISVGDIVAYTDPIGQRVIGTVIRRWGRYCRPQMEICNDTTLFHPVYDYTKCKVLERF